MTEIGNYRIYLPHMEAADAASYFFWAQTGPIELSDSDKKELMAIEMAYDRCRVALKAEIKKDSPLIHWRQELGFMLRCIHYELWLHILSSLSRAGVEGLDVEGAWEVVRQKTLPRGAQYGWINDARKKLAEEGEMP